MKTISQIIKQYYFLFIKYELIAFAVNRIINGLILDNNVGASIDVEEFVNIFCLILHNLTWGKCAFCWQI